MAHNEFNKHEQTVQELQNRGFDPSFDVPTAEILGYDDGNNALRRIAVDANGKLEVGASALPTGAATAANQTDKSQYTKLTDGITDVSIHAVGIDGRTNTLNAVATEGFNMNYNGSTWDRVRGDTTDGLLVNLGSNNDVSLNAGTNAIGKLAANSGVDIGDVDVLTLPSPISGPGNPTIDSYQTATITAKTGANQLIVSSAPSKQIWVYGFGFSGTIAGTVAFQDEDDTVLTGAMNIANTGGFVSSPSGNFAMPLFKLATDKDLEMDIVTTTINGWVAYAIVSV